MTCATGSILQALVLRPAFVTRQQASCPVQVSRPTHSMGVVPAGHVVMRAVHEGTSPAQHVPPSAHASSVTLGHGTSLRLPASNGQTIGATPLLLLDVIPLLDPLFELPLLPPPSAALPSPSGTQMSIAVSQRRPVRHRPVSQRPRNSPGFAFGSGCTPPLPGGSSPTHAATTASDDAAAANAQAHAGILIDRE